MWDYIEERTIRCAEYIVATGCTVRACSAHFGVSKSTVHKDITERLAYIDGELFEKVREILNFNLSERHIRGGNATREKYKPKSSRSLSDRGASMHASPIAELP